MKTYLKIHKDDNVAVALSPLKEGTKVIIDDQEITLKEDIPQGHKFALTDINKEKHPLSNMEHRLVWRKNQFKLDHGSTHIISKQD